MRNDMKTFTDRTGRSWNVEITVSALKRVRDLAKLDLGQIAEEPAPGVVPLGRRLDDLATLGEVLFALVKPQADAQKVSQEDFLDALDGPAMGRASAAFWPELDCFFRPCLPLVGGLIALALEVRSQAQAQAAPAPASGSESTGSPAQSASTPVP